MHAVRNVLLKLLHGSRSSRIFPRRGESHGWQRRMRSHSKPVYRRRIQERHPSGLDGLCLGGADCLPTEPEALRVPSTIHLGCEIPRDSLLAPFSSVQRRALVPPYRSAFSPRPEDRLACRPAGLGHALARDRPSNLAPTVDPASHFSPENPLGHPGKCRVPGL